MRKTALVTAIFMSLPVMVPAQAQGLPQERSYQGRDHNNGYRPANRPPRQRFVCVLDRRAADGARRTTCPANAGRVGGRCRCEGAIGNGTRQTW